METLLEAEVEPVAHLGEMAKRSNAAKEVWIDPHCLPENYRPRDVPVIIPLLPAPQIQLILKDPLWVGHLAPPSTWLDSFGEALGCARFVVGAFQISSHPILVNTRDGMVDLSIHIVPKADSIPWVILCAVDIVSDVPSDLSLVDFCIESISDGKSGFICLVANFAPGMHNLIQRWQVLVARLGDRCLLKYLFPLALIDDLVGTFFKTFLRIARPECLLELEAQSLPGSVVVCTGEVSAIVALATYDFKCFLLTLVPALGTFVNCNLVIVIVGLVRVIFLGSPVVEVFAWIHL